MFGSFLGAWLLFPLALLLASFGCGLLVRRIAAAELSWLLVTPVGFALVVTLCAFATSYSWLAPAGGAIVAVVALVGLVLEARGGSIPALRPRFGPWVWPALAGLAAFAAVGGPVFLTGAVGWTGYTRIVDIAFQMDFAQYVAHAGRALPSNGNSSFNIVASKLLGIGYPGGSQSTLGEIADLVHVNVAWCYQSFLAFTAAMGAVAIYSTLGHVTSNRLLRCIGAAIAMQPNILYGYALEAGIKELSTAALLMVVVAVLVDGLPGTGARRRAVSLSVAVSAAYAAFSLGVAPWLGLMIVGSFALSLAKRDGHRHVLESWGVFAVAAVAISLPAVSSTIKLFNVAGTAIGGVVELGLGNLAAPVSKWASAGVWLTGDYRYPIANATSSHLLDILIIALAALGVIVAAVRGRWALTAIGATAPIALYYFIEHSSAWIQLKSFTITSAFVVMLAFVGAAVLQSDKRRPLVALGWLCALVVSGGVLYGNALIYHDTTLAPGERYRDLAAVAARYAGKGPALDPYFDEYAEYFLRGDKGTSIVNPANLSFEVLPGVAPAGGQSFGWDLNQLVPSFLQKFPLIIQPRSPVASRAPSNYDLLEKTRYFEVWRRDRPSSTVIAHLPLSSLPHERTPAYCRNFLSVLHRAGPGVEIAYAQTSVVAVGNPVAGPHPTYWRPLGPSTLATAGAGSDEVTVTLPSSEHYEIWLQGSIGRPLQIYLDGRRLTKFGYEERYPDQFLLFGSADLKAGVHKLRLVRGNGSLHPGSGDPKTETIGRTLGAIVFSAEGTGSRSTANPSEDRVYVAPAGQAAKLCAAPVGYQWLEVIKPAGAPANALPAA